MKKSQILKNIQNILKERMEINSEIGTIEKQLFKIENEYLTMTQGNNLFRNLEFYIHTKPEKKKTIINDDDRVFGRDFPKQDNN